MSSSPASSDILGTLFGQAAQHPSDPQIQTAFAQNLAQSCNWEEQKAWFEKLAAQAAASGTATLAFIEACCRAGMGNPPRPREVAVYALTLLERAAQNATPDDNLPLMMSHIAYLQNELGNFPAAEVAARRAHGGSNAIYHFWLAEALYEQRKFINDPACAIDLSTLRVEHFQDLVNQLERERAGRSYVPGETVYQFSGDAVYFRRFVVPQTLSLAQFGKPFRIHFHIFDPDTSSSLLAERLAKTLPHFHFSMTTETVNLPDIHSKRSYYAFARYLQAYNRFREGHTVVVADADLLFRDNPQKLLDQAAGYDVGIVKFEGQPLSNRYNASFVVFHQTFFAELLLKALDRFLKVQFKRPSLIWILDQISLYCCIRRLIEVTAGQARAFEWPEQTICIHQLDTSPIWNGATNRKWTDSPYDRLRRNLLIEYGFDPAEF